MNKKYFRINRLVMSLMTMAFLAVLCSCSGNGSNLPENKDGTTATIGTGSAAGAPATNIALSATPSTIATGTTSSIRAVVTTSTGGNVNDGTVVSFTLSSSMMGTISSQASTSNGIASATFTASSVPGTVTITAKAGSINQTTAVSISAAGTGNIEFVSASPQIVGIKGSGQPSTSTAKFLVKDINGKPVIDGTQVDFLLNGPGGGKLPSNGGEYIGSLDATPTTASASTVSGYVSVTLNSGSVAGPVTITASVTSGTQVFSASSSVISIGGGLPSASHFNLATTKVNLPGLVWSNKTADISAYIADRFGNYNVLKGTTVSFYTEAGAINTSNLTDDTGITTVSFRSQLPTPVRVIPTAWETALINYLNTTYSLAIPTDGSYNPRNGWLTILATVQGEEAFLDENANGIFDRSVSTSPCMTGYSCECDNGTSVTGSATCSGGSKRSEPFKDLGEPFIDKDDDGCRNDGANKNCAGVVASNTDPFEEYIDINGNSQYDAPNGVWDGPGCSGNGCLSSKMVWTSIRLAFSGNPYYCTISPATFTILNGGSQTFKFMVGDINTSMLVPGTTISVTADKGNLTGQTSFIVADGLPAGPTEISFTLNDPDSATTSIPAEPSTVTVTVTPAEDMVKCTAYASGTVQ